MIEKLKINIIYNNFLNNVRLTDEQIKILDMMIKKETRYKISREIGTSERTINYEIKKIKDLYREYKNLQIIIANLLKE